MENSSSRSTFGRRRIPKKSERPHPRFQRQHRNLESRVWHSGPMADFNTTTNHRESRPRLKPPAKRFCYQLNRRPKLQPSATLYHCSYKLIETGAQDNIVISDTQVNGTMNCSLICFAISSRWIGERVFSEPHCSVTRRHNLIVTYQLSK